MINRINLIMRAKNITAKQFAEEIGIQPSGMSHILGGRNNPSLEFAMKVLRRYPEIDANWLLLGRGAMYGGGATAQPVAHQDDAVADYVPVGQVIEPDTDNVADAVLDDAPIWPEADEMPAEQPKRKVVRMMLIYNDNTFVEYRPRG